MHTSSTARHIQRRRSRIVTSATRHDPVKRIPANHVQSNTRTLAIRSNRIVLWSEFVRKEFSPAIIRRMQPKIGCSNEYCATRLMVSGNSD